MYMVVMALSILVPGLTALWVFLLMPLGDALSQPYVSQTVTAVVLPLALVCGHLIGIRQGPAVRHPALTSIIVWSNAFRRPAFILPVLVVAGIACVLGITLSTAAVIVSGAHEMHGLPASIGLVLVGGLTGAVAVAGSLLGQLLTTGAGARSAAILGAGAVLTAAGAYLGPSAPTIGWAMTFGLLEATALLTAATVISARVIETVDPSLLMAHSLRWHTLSSYAWSFDAKGARSVYFQRPPRRGRRVLSATMPRRARFAGAMLIRGLVAGLRTPGLTVTFFLVQGLGITLLLWALCGVVDPALALPAVLIAYVGVTESIPGVRHVLHAVSGVRIFGVGDAALLTSALVPVIAVSGSAILLSLAGTAAWTDTEPRDLWTGSVIVLLTIISCLASFIASELRGPMPAWLFGSMSVAIGDPMVLMRLAWPIEAVLLAACVGYTIGMVPTIGGAGASLLFVGLLCLYRWRRRDK